MLLINILDKKKNKKKNHFPGQWSQPQAARLQAAFVQHSQTQGMDFGWCCVDPEVGLNDPCGFLPTQDFLVHSWAVIREKYFFCLEKNFLYWFIVCCSKNF